MSEITINGPEGRIQARYHHQAKSEQPIALLLHAHPQYGGNMNNRIMQVLFQTFRQLGFSVLRFDFRLSDKPQKYQQGESELCDATAALDWLQSCNAESSRCWICGLSFGSWIGMQMLMRRPEISGFLSLSPPAGIHDFSFLAPCPTSGLILHGSKDELVDSHQIDRLMAHISRQKKITVTREALEGGNHFFSGKEDQAAKIVQDYILRFEKESGHR